MIFLRRVLAGLLIPLALVAAVTLASMAQEDDQRLHRAQAASGDAFLPGELGTTRYRRRGPVDAPAVVLIHSFNGYLESWRPNEPALLAAGYQVISYDLWGRGLSSRPQVPLDLTAFRDQLNALIQYLELPRVHLVGASFGSVIATDYHLNGAVPVDGLVLSGPAGWPTPGGATALLQVPGLADAIFHWFGVSILRGKVREYLIDPAGHQWALDAWERYAQLPGLARSALSTLRHAPVQDYTSGWKALGADGHPVLVLWGREDLSFPHSHTRHAEALIPQAKIVSLDHAAHWVNIEQPRQLNQAIVEFLGAGAG